MLLYDPRYERRIKTDNPAIIMANMVLKSNLIDDDKQFWNTIKKLANYADFDVVPNEKKNLVRAKTSKTKKA